MGTSAQSTTAGRKSRRPSASELPATEPRWQWQRLAAILAAALVVIAGLSSISPAQANAAYQCQGDGYHSCRKSTDSRAAWQAQMLFYKMAKKGGFSYALEAFYTVQFDINNYWHQDHALRSYARSLEHYERPIYTNRGRRVDNSHIPERACLSSVAMNTIRLLDDASTRAQATKRALGLLKRTAYINRGPWGAYQRALIRSGIGLFEAARKVANDQIIRDSVNQLLLCQGR
ncbi:MAG: hypothetical protein KDC39_15095 [Actinobacteria bacterium]|nr:hypothetical protein [Actinomycetota bacterium]